MFYRDEYDAYNTVLSISLRSLMDDISSSLFSISLSLSNSRNNVIWNRMKQTRRLFTEW